MRIRINGEVRELSDAIELDKNQLHTIEIVVDRLVKKPLMEERLVDSLTTCLRHSGGVAVISILPQEIPKAMINPGEPLMTLPKVAETAEIAYLAAPVSPPLDLVFSENFACPEHGAVMEELSPRLFSFNSPYGACPHCHGLGSLRAFSPELVVPNQDLPVYAAIAPWSDKDNSYYFSLLYSVGKAYKFDLQTPWKHLTPQQQRLLLYGTEEEIWIDVDSRYREGKGYNRRYEGAIPILQRQYNEANSEAYKQRLEQYLVDQTCEVCEGKRLKPEALAVRLGQYNMLDLTSVPIRECLHRVHNVQLTSRQAQIGDLVLREIKARLQFLLDVGLDYLTLNRTAMTLSGGEAQRIRLATQIGAGLTGVLYVLDEPSIGLHQRDNGRLLRTLTRLRDLGNTLIVVEHDEETIRAADYLVDIGPGAGVHGGRIVAQGGLAAVLSAPDSLTGAYLSGRRRIITPAQRREGNGRALRLKNCLSQ